MADTLEQIAGWASALRFEQVPAAAIDLVKRAFLDTVSVSLSGSRLASTRCVARIAFEQGPASGACSVVGHGRKIGALDAALINGTAAHAELFDDNNKPMISHPSAPLVSALLPLGQLRVKSGRDVLTAYTVGFEIGVLLGRKLNPQMYERGWHVTRVLGTLGTAAACARLIGLDAGRTAHAVGIAASMASGIRQNFGTMTMGVHAGLAARDGVHAALLAEAGLEADAGALDGRYGFFNLFAGKPPADLPLGKPFELIASGIIFKPFPCGAPTHAAVDAALALHIALGGRIDSIERVRVLVHPWNAMTLREGPVEDTLRARVSMRYCVAAALVFGALGSPQFTESAVRDPRVRALMERIDVAVVDGLPDNGLFPAEVQLRLTDGGTLTERREIPPGAPERPWTAADAERKFRGCATGIIAEAALADIPARIAAMEALPQIATLCVLLEGSAS